MAGHALRVEGFVEQRVDIAGVFATADIEGDLFDAVRLLDPECPDLEPLEIVFRRRGELESWLQQELQVVGRRKYPPAEPEALRLRAPQRGLIAIAEQQDPASSPEYNGLPTIIQSRTGHLATVTAGIVKLLLPPRQSRGISLWGLVQLNECYFTDGLACNCPK